MRFLLLTAIGMGATLARASSLTQETEAHESPLPLYSGLNLKELEKLEYDRPDDPALKLELARQYWCQGDRGLAVEHWRWLDQSSRGPEGDKALAYLGRIKTKAPTLNTELCVSYPQKTL
jgi:hypothetical protein